VPLIFLFPIKKKNVLSFESDRRSLAKLIQVEFSVELAKKLFASRLVLRKKLVQAPMKIMLPDFVVSSTVGPARVPYSAE